MKIKKKVKIRSMWHVSILMVLRSEAKLAEILVFVLNEALASALFMEDANKECARWVRLLCYVRKQHKSDFILLRVVEREVLCIDQEYKTVNG